MICGLPELAFCRGRFLIEDRDPASASLDPGRALNQWAIRKAPTGFLALAKGLVIEDYGSRVGHKAVKSAKAVMGNLSFLHCC